MFYFTGASAKKYCIRSQNFRYGCLKIFRVNGRKAKGPRQTDRLPKWLLETALQLNNRPGFFANPDFVKI